MAAPSKATESRLPRGRALLLEHIAQLRFLHSSQGVLLIIYQNGDACFFPVNDQSKTPTSSVKLLTNAQKKLKGSVSCSGRGLIACIRCTRRARVSKGY